MTPNLAHDFQPNDMESITIMIMYFKYHKITVMLRVKLMSLNDLRMHHILDQEKCSACSSFSKYKYDSNLPIHIQRATKKSTHEG